MNYSDWIVLVQTIVLACTGFIVYWYTKETQKIRKETSNQNNLLAEQLKLMKDKLVQEERRERSLLEPFFVYNGGGSSVNGINISLINKGSVIKNIKIRNLELSLSYSPKDILESDRELRFHFNKLAQDLPDEIEFILEYEDKFGEKREKVMILYPPKRKIIEK